MLIGLKGHMNSGKDTFYKFMKEIDERTERVAFADKLKEIASATLGIDFEAIDSLKYDENFYWTPDYQNFWVDALGERVTIPRFNMRQYLQRLGTEAMREKVHDNFWINLALPLTLKHEGRIIVVTDMRFENEFERVKFLGGYTVLILRDSTNVDQHLHHASEVVLDPSRFDYVISNNDTLDEFKLSVEALYTELFQAGGPKGGVRIIEMSEEQSHTEVPLINEGNQNGSNERRAIQGSPEEA